MSHRTQGGDQRVEGRRRSGGAGLSETKPLRSGSTWSVHAGLYVIPQGRTIAHSGARPESHVERLLLAAFQLSFRRRIFLTDTGKPCGSLGQLHTVLGHRHRRKGRQGDVRRYGLHCSHLHLPVALSPALPVGTGALLASSPFSVKRKYVSFFGPCFCCSIQPLFSRFSTRRVLAGRRRAWIQPSPRKYCMNWRSR